MDGSLLSLYAKGPQDEFLIDKTKRIEETFDQYSDFSIDMYNVPLNSAKYFGTTHTATLHIKTLPGDLIRNMFLRCTLPDLTQITGSHQYVESVGRSLIRSITLHVNDVEIERIIDDWEIIMDEFFLDDDEKKINKQLINGTELYIPFDFFFSNRFQKNTPCFPLCAVKNQILYVTIEFADITQISTLSDNPNLLDLQNPTLIFEMIKLTPYELLRYKEPFDVRVNKIYKEPSSELQGREIVTNLTANFEVTSMFWFIRYKLYENNQDLVLKRYDYGFNLITNILNQNSEPFEYTSIYLNNEEISDRFSSEKFYKYTQPLLHGLSTPEKNIYMYSFANDPKSYEKSGCFDFRKVKSKSSYLSLRIKDERIRDFSQNYSFNVFHRGYTYYHFENGSCSQNYIF